ncbi:uncharacterized protein NECHADRAFT_89537 [Fusarium vanettenii 77-13-4]|uniref:Uncharacterized protein n=1 Tax=Fusarium vanettenii (strain ATCC MYA-4622 / CBS 123669 / FGSC 9596 / NRRL 45880 / 77-13-4) TaxID=660122 RepID=C7ZRH1_FUSV7|nr:uncharacterized protein NECHADRAFT_89537 [Fusarium vanettenii 77-13-4]EEU33386.1 predicted protein [Fusarium vanettenii 77-13-4]
MPQWLINGPQRMMEDGAISDSPPETGTGGSRGFWHEVAPDWFPERVDRAERAKCVITPRLTGPKSPFPCSGVGETTRRLGGCSLDYYLLVLGAPVPVPLMMAGQPQKRREPANSY